jgi:predicted TIM-barrel fold metal-dependent hydrolase
MFAADYPFERMADGAEWFDSLPLDGRTRAQIAHENARALLGL